MASPHLTVELIRQWLDGAIDDRAFLKALFPHLVASCPTCNVIWAEATRGLIPGRGLFASLQLEGVHRGLSSEEAMQRALVGVREMKSKILARGSEEKAAARMDQLLAKPFEEQLLTIQKSRSVYVQPPVAQGLIERSRHAVRSDPERSKQLAMAAVAVSRKVWKRQESWRSVGADLHAHALALQGNAERLLGEYSRAEKRLREAHLTLDHGSGDVVLFADILSLDASLAVDQYRFEDAIRHGRRARKIYQRCGEAHKVGRIDMQLSLIYSEAGDPGKSVAAIREALEHLDFEAEPCLEVLAHENLALFLAEAGDPHRGLEILREHPLPTNASQRSRLRREWQEARIQIQLGAHSKASATLTVLRQDFARLGDAPSTALVGLDLALAFASDGLFQEVKKVAATTLPLLQKMAIPQDIWAALLLFQKAAKTENVCRQVIQEIRGVVGDRRKWRVGLVAN